MNGAMFRGVMGGIVLISFLGAGSAPQGAPDPGNRGGTAGDAISRSLMRNLSLTIAAPDPLTSSWKRSESLIYVLGGSQESLSRAYRLAASLYKEGNAGKVYYMSRPGITEYDPTKSRNLTNDEWSNRELAGLGVPANDLEAVSVQTSTFGTLSEGRAVSRLAREKGFRRIILIASSYHTRRAYLTFSHFLRGDLEIYVYGSGGPSGTGALIVEFGKLVLYREILIPIVRWTGSEGNLKPEGIPKGTGHGR